MERGRILITGATGFVGRHLVERLAAAGHPLTLAVRDERKVPVPREGVRVIQAGALETSDQLDRALNEAGAVVHLSGLAHIQSHADGEAAFDRANAIATKRLADAACRAGVRSFIHISSLATVTGNASDIVIDDRTQAAPETAYGRSKLAAELHVARLAERGVFAVSLRPPLIVGADARGNWAALQKIAATGAPLPFANATSKRSMIGVASLVEAIERLLAREWPADRSGTYAVADPEALALRDIVGELRAGMGISPRLFPFPAAIVLGLAKIAGQERRASGLLGPLIVDATRFARTFDFQPLTDLRTQIRASGAEYIKLKAGRQA